VRAKHPFGLDAELDVYTIEQRRTRPLHVCLLAVADLNSVQVHQDRYVELACIYNVKCLQLANLVALPAWVDETH